MKTRTITYKGQPPDVLEDPNLAAILELFKQQNEIIKATAVRTYLIPAGTQLSVHEFKEQGDGEPG